MFINISIFIKLIGRSVMQNYQSVPILVTNLNLKEQLFWLDITAEKCRSHVHTWVYFDTFKIPWQIIIGSKNGQNHNFKDIQTLVMESNGQNLAFKVSKKRYEDLFFCCANPQDTSLRLGQRGRCCFCTAYSIHKDVSCGLEK